MELGNLTALNDTVIHALAARRVMEIFVQHLPNHQCGTRVSGQDVASRRNRVLNKRHIRMLLRYDAGAEKCFATLEVFHKTFLCAAYALHVVA